MIVRRFNSAGVSKFAEFIEQQRASPSDSGSIDFLEDDEYSQPIQPARAVSNAPCANRRELGSRLLEATSDIPQHVLRKDRALWTWLAACFFDSICPRKNGLRKPLNAVYYIFNDVDDRYARRHLLFHAWRISAAAPQHHKLLFAGPVSGIDKVSEKVMERLFLTRIKGIYDALDKLYWDTSRGAPKRGLSDYSLVKRGDLMHRLPRKIQQLEMTFDLQDLDCDQLLNILGDEFRGL